MGNEWNGLHTIIGFRFFFFQIQLKFVCELSIYILIRA